MISATAGQLADLLEVNRREGLRVRIADNTDTLQDVTDHVISVPEITIDVNANARTATVELQRETASGSLSPLMSGTPAIYPRRRVVIDLAVKKYDESIGGSDWVELFNGFVDTPQFGGREARMVLPCRDHWRVLYDTYIETEGTYGSSGGTAIATVLQSLLDDNLGGSSYTLSVVGTPTTTIFEYTQRRMRLSEALMDLANYTGWHLRFQGTTLVYEEPPRSKTTPDYTFTTKQYFDVPTLAIDPSGIVNRVIVQYDAENAEVGEDASSVATWGKLVAFIDSTQDAQITNSASAQALANIIVSDRANPLTLMTVKGRLHPFIDIWDLCRWPTDGILYSSALDLAVSKVIHSFPAADSNTPPSTTLHLQGSPSGGVDRWERLRFKTERAQEVTDVVGAPSPQPDVSVSARIDGSGNLSAIVDGSDLAIQSWKIAGAIGSEPDQATVEGQTAIDGTHLDQTDIGNLDTGATPGDIGHVAAIGYSGTGGAGMATAVYRDSAFFGVSETGIPDDSIGGAKLKAGAVSSDKQTSQSQSFSSTVRFEATTYTSIRWYSGVVRLANGTSVTVADRGSPLTISGVTFIYFDGTTTAKTTTDPTDLQDEDVVLLATAWPSINTSSACTIVSAVGALGDEGNLVVAGDNVAVNAITAAKASIITLSSLTADVGVLTGGLLQNSSGTTYIDLDATGSGTFIACGTDLIMRADGTAVFDGEVSASSFTATEITVNSVRLSNGHTIIGDLGPGGEISISPDVTNGWLFDTRVTADSARLGGASGVLLSLRPSSTNLQVNGGLYATNGDSELDGNVILAGASDQVGFYGSSGIIKPTITGSRGGNAALASLLTELEGMGLITDSST